jgi:DNA/RNA endonuclease G (NUC1)
MKTKLIFILIMAISPFLKAQTTFKPIVNHSEIPSKIQQVITYPGYTSYWNSETLIPDSVIYIAKPHTKAADREANFHPTGGRLNENRDYAKSGYDQGHLCNASDENGNKTDEYNSFDQCNIYPQRPNCNRLTWLDLENYIRQLATQYGQVKVKVYWHGKAGYMGPDKVTIPKFCDKEIWYNGIHEYYSMPNSDSVKLLKCKKM